MNPMEMYEKWLHSPALTQEEKAELISIQNDPSEITSRFSKAMTFGTAGLRSTMKLGTDHMNRHTVAQATQGLAALISELGRNADGCVIAYDSRCNSELFAKTAACVLAANGISVYLFDDVRPTPELSFALRELRCVAGINITASHNPKEYNGYKAYWQDGAQLSPELAETVYRKIGSVDLFDGVLQMPYDEALKTGKITLLGSEMDEKYLQQVRAQAINPDEIRKAADDLCIVYTPLHGAGYRLVPEIIRRSGIRRLFTVEEQMTPNGEFPTLKKPNPEYPEAFACGIRVADRVRSDLIIATDPDADRVGVMTRTADGSFATITGNQMGALLLDYIITAYQKTGTMPSEPYAVKSIVTSELATKICQANQVTMYNVLTGFKFIGEVIKQHELAGHGSFLFGFEESYGYLKGTYARDKDAVVTTMLICEMAAFYHNRNMTLSDALREVYQKYGYCYESNVEMYMNGADGAARMANFMQKLRQDPPANFAGIPVCAIGDYLAQTLTEGTVVAPTGLPQSDVLSYRLQNGDVIVVRPSGTEPKIKFYYLLQATDPSDGAQKMHAYHAVLDRYTAHTDL